MSLKVPSSPKSGILCSFFYFMPYPCLWARSALHLCAICKLLHFFHSKMLRLIQFSNPKHEGNKANFSTVFFVISSIVFCGSSWDFKSREKRKAHNVLSISWSNTHHPISSHPQLLSESFLFFCNVMALNLGKMERNKIEPKVPYSFWTFSLLF